LSETKPIEDPFSPRAFKIEVFKTQQQRGAAK